MYEELEMRIAHRGISKKKLADDIHMNYRTLLAKMGGRSRFTLDEAVQIRTYLEEDVSIEELFGRGDASRVMPLQRGRDNCPH